MFHIPSTDDTMGNNIYKTTVLHAKTLYKDFYPHIHYAKALTKSTLRNTEKILKDEVELTRNHKFRQKADIVFINITYYASKEMVILIPQKEWKKDISVLYIGNDDLSEDIINNLDKYHFICINGKNEPLNARIRNNIKLLLNDNDKYSA